MLQNNHENSFNNLPSTNFSLKVNHLVMPINHFLNQFMSDYIQKRSTLEPLSWIKTLYEQVKSDWENTQLSGD